MARFLIPSLTASLLLAASPALAGNGNGNGNGNNNTLVCHVTGNGSVNPLWVNSNALSAHLGHGDAQPSTWFLDNDGDGVGDSGATVEACAAPAGYVSIDGDCDDADPSVSPALQETCDNGIDDNCDGQVDEGCLNLGSCPVPTEYTICDVDLATGAISCDNGTPLHLLSLAGIQSTYRLDMTDWDVAIMDFETLVTPPYSSGGEFSINIGNSPSNDGWKGDASQFANDSEVQLYNNSIHLFRNDVGGANPYVALGIGDATDTSGDLATAVVCDSFFSWESSTAAGDLTDPHIFQIDGDEPDAQAGGLNDQQLWLGINRVIRHGFRNGDGVTGLTVIFGR